jgi:thiol-disulfide isomerase/thioredoxin
MKVVYYFTADWCNPCKKTRPIVEEMNRETHIKFQIIDVDSELELAKRFEIPLRQQNFFHSCKKMYSKKRIAT